jgi:ferrous-iron efflux pump FieF
MVTTPHKRLLTLTAAASVLVAVTLILVKTVAWQMSGSVSLLASLLDSLMDSLASLINLAAIRYALVPADTEHRFGHGKAEALAGLGQATFIGLSSLYLLWQAVGRAISPVVVEHAHAGIGVMVFSILLTAGLLLWQRHVIKKTGSTAIAADWIHYLSDLVVNLGIIVALLLAAIGWSRADGIIGVIIAILIFWSAWKLGAESVQLLLDREIPGNVRDEVGAIVARHELALGFHDLRTRQSGYTQFIQLHVDMDENLPLKRAHDLAESIEQDIRARFPQADVIIHEDPVAESPHVSAK